MKSKHNEQYYRFFSEHPLHVEKVVTKTDKEFITYRVVRDYSKRFLFIPYTKTVEIARCSSESNIRDVFGDLFRKYLREKSDKDFRNLKKSLSALR